MLRPSHLLLLIPVLLLACNGGSRTGEDDAGIDSTDPRIAALRDIDARILQSPGNAALYAERAAVHARFDSLHLAEQDWLRAISLDSTNVDHHVALGDLYYRKVRLGDARSRFERAMAIDPSSNKATLKLAELELVERRYPRAMELANEALRRDQLEPKGYYLKGWVHMEIGDTAMAISSLRTAVEMDPQHYDAYMQLGILHARRGDPLAVEYLGTALEIRPNSTEALYARALFHQEQGRDSLALADYASMKELDPADARAWFNTGYILLEHLGASQEAKAEFSGAIERYNLYPEAFYNRGLAHERTAMFDSAALDYQRALKLRPEMDLAAEGLNRLQAIGIHISR